MMIIDWSSFVLLQGSANTRGKYERDDYERQVLMALTWVRSWTGICARFPVLSPRNEWCSLFSNSASPVNRNVQTWRRSTWSSSRTSYRSSTGSLWTNPPYASIPSPEIVTLVAIFILLGTAAAGYGETSNVATVLVGVVTTLSMNSIVATKPV